MKTFPCSQRAAVNARKQTRSDSVDVISLPIQLPPLCLQARSRAPYRTHRPDEVRSLGGLIKKRNFCNSDATTASAPRRRRCCRCRRCRRHHRYCNQRRRSSRSELVNEVRRSSAAHENDSRRLRNLLRCCK